MNNTKLMNMTLKYIGSVLFVLILSGCVTQKWCDIEDNVNMETIMQEKFQSLYQRYKIGEIEVSKIEQQIDSNGEVNYRITYSEKYADTDEFLWQTIYMPILNQ